MFVYVYYISFLGCRRVVRSKCNKTVLKYQPLIYKYNNDSILHMKYDLLKPMVKALLCFNYNQKII